MNAAPPESGTAEQEQAIETIEAPVEKPVEYSPDLYAFLDGLAQNDPSRKAEIMRARESLAKGAPGPALAETYLFSSAWEMQAQTLSHQDPYSAETDQAMEAYLGSRRIFMNNCVTAFPEIPLIAREEVDPSPEMAIDRIDAQTNELVVRLEQMRTKEASRQLEIDVMAIYRLQEMRDELEREIAQRPPQELAVPERTVPKVPRPSVTEPTLASVESAQDLRKGPEGHYLRLGLQDEFGISFEQWVKDGLRNSPDYKIFGDEPEDLEKWRALERGIDEIRDWWMALKPEEKRSEYQTLMDKLEGVLSKF